MRKSSCLSASLRPPDIADDARMDLLAQKIILMHKRAHEPSLLHGCVWLDSQADTSKSAFITFKDTGVQYEKNI